VASLMGLGRNGVGGGVSTTNLGVSVEGYGLCLSWWMDGHIAGFSYGRSVMSWQLSSWLRSMDRRGDDWLHMYVSSLLPQCQSMKGGLLQTTAQGELLAACLEDGDVQWCWWSSLLLRRNKCGGRYRARWRQSFLGCRGVDMSRMPVAWSAWQRSPASGDFFCGAWV
jgi:hypothetical protein